MTCSLQLRLHLMQGRSNAAPTGIIVRLFFFWGGVVFLQSQSRKRNAFEQIIMFLMPLRSPTFIEGNVLRWK